MRSGDAANLFVLLNTAVFLAVALADSLGAVRWVSDSFRRDGFCVNAKNTMFDSHLLAFHVDTITALVLTGLARHFKDAPGIKNSAVELGAAGVFAHGLGHLGLWAGTLPTDGEALVLETEPGLALKFAKKIPPLFGFFFMLFRSGPNIGDRHAAGHSLLHAAVLAALVPAKLGFTYVQTVLLWVAAAYDMLRPAASKDRYYDLNALVITLPVGLVSWAEAFACDSLLGQDALTFKSVGGHMWYDACIPLSMFAYYALVLPDRAAKSKAA